VTTLARDSNLARLTTDQAPNGPDADRDVEHREGHAHPVGGERPAGDSQGNEFRGKALGTETLAVMVQLALSDDMRLVSDRGRADTCGNPLGRRAEPRPSAAA
jgi:hypothetical protein